MPINIEQVQSIAREARIAIRIADETEEGLVVVPRKDLLNALAVLIMIPAILKELEDLRKTSPKPR